MTVKEYAIHIIEELADDTTWSEVQERINFVAGVRQGLQQLDEGKGIPHQQIREEYAAWLAD